MQSIRNAKPETVETASAFAVMFGFGMLVVTFSVASVALMVPGFAVTVLGLLVLASVDNPNVLDEFDE